ncbi:hypothetical protein [Xylanimonas protaetiae]|uniref:hypothetical protein n=1 Tax=Xylanimonas protaetiae TaxID=2509457 RepID=UPI001F5D3C54|nr:hypothetical protein [Xylanimonas protaetiae]
MKTRHVAPAGALALALVASGSWAPAFGAPKAPPSGDPDFGPNVTFVDPSWTTEQINALLDSINDEGEFSQNRHQVFFEPGVYGSAAGQDDPATATGIVNQTVGYYESVAGLGAQPGDVLVNGAFQVNPVVRCPDTPWACQDPGSLTRFWRSLSNLAINPIQTSVGTDRDYPFPRARSTRTRCGGPCRRPRPCAASTSAAT